LTRFAPIPHSLLRFVGPAARVEVLAHRRTETLGIPCKPFRGREKLSEFRTREKKIKQTLGIPFRGTKIEANFRNIVPKHFAEETRSHLCLLEQEICVLNHFLKTLQPKISEIVSEKTPFVVRTNHF
jgi:hypothetical protein